jgi:hypothetical protein
LRSSSIKKKLGRPPIYLDSITCASNVTWVVKLISSYFTTIPDGWVAGLNENKANSASQLKLELGLG